MSRWNNPFKLSTGATPPVLVGHQALLEELAEGLEDGPGHRHA